MLHEAKMLDNLFIDYANKLFKDNPKNLKVVFQDFIGQRYGMFKTGRVFDTDRIRLDFIIDTIFTFSDCSNFNSALKLKDKIKSKGQKLFKKISQIYLYRIDNYIELALEAVFFYRIGCCDGTRHENESCIGYRSDQYDFGLDANIRLKCHECRQLFFRHMLMDFVSDKDFDEGFLDGSFPGQGSVITIRTTDPKDFHNYVFHAYDCVKIRAITSTRNKIVQGVVKEESISFTNLFDDQDSIYPLNTRFNDYLKSMVSYSLIEFLRNNNPKKLKNCPYCNNFFIAKSINRKTRCYEPDCEKAYQRDKKRKQRDKDPVKYN
jgi:hypothetical protein